MPLAKRSLRHISLTLAVFLGLLVAATIVAAIFLYHYYQSQEIAKLTVKDEGQTTTVPPTIPPEKKPLALRVPILLYHYVEHVKDPGDTIRQKLDIYPEVLESQIKTLKNDGYTFVSMADVATALDKEQPLPAKPIILTFDDGYRDFYTDVLPILEKENTKATVYVISGFTGRPNNMTFAQLQKVVASGLVEIGAHTIHHVDLSHASVRLATEEIADSKTQLEKLLGVTVTSFAYPDGRFNTKTVELVQSAGYTTAVSTHPGTEITTDNRFVLYRLRPGMRTGKELLSFLTKELTKKN